MNFNPECATAGKITIAEVEEIVPVGSLDKMQIHTPGVYVQRIFAANHEKRIENVQHVRLNGGLNLCPGIGMMAARAAKNWKMVFTLIWE